MASAAPLLGARDRLSRMLERLCNKPAHRVSLAEAAYTIPDYRQETYVPAEATVALGRVTLGYVNRAPQPAMTRDGRFVAMMAGELYDADSVRQQLSTTGISPVGESHAELLALGYQSQGPRFFAGLEGHFTASLWDNERQELVLVNDGFGLKQLYYSELDGRLLFASEIKALLTDEAVSRDRHVPGIARFFAYGYLWGEDTLYEGVKCLPPATCLVYSPRDGKLQQETYWSLHDLPRRSPATSEPSWEGLTHAFQSAVSRRAGEGERLGLSLSGGLDARTILAAMDQARAPVTTVSLGIPGCLDHRCASRLAEITGCPHHRFDLNASTLDLFEENLRRMTRFTDGHYLDQCIVLPTLPLYRDLGIEVLLRGHAGELLHMDKAYNYSLDAEAWDIHDDSSLEHWLTTHLQAYMLREVDRPLFACASQEEIESLAREDLLRALETTRGAESPLERIWHLFVTHRLPRETGMSLAKIGSFVETRVPYLDKEFLAEVFSIPLPSRVGDRAQADMLARLRPEFLHVVNANTGAPLRAHPLREKFAGLRMKVFAKLGVPSYQPYERLGLWLRRELADMVRRILLDDRCLDRGVFQPDTVRRVVEQHHRNQRNHTFLLMAMMIYELGQRDFVDGELPEEKAPSADVDAESPKPALASKES